MKSIVSRFVAVVSVTALCCIAYWYTQRGRPITKPVPFPVTQAKPQLISGTTPVPSIEPKTAAPTLSLALHSAWTNALYLPRKLALLRLGKDLPQTDCQFLCEFLRSPMNDQDLDLNAAVKNTVLDVLRGQSNLPTPYHQLLIGLFHDQNQHIILRDYAIQHLVHWYEESLSQTTLKSAREEVRPVFWSALDGAPATCGGTALLGLQYLSERDAVIEPQKVGMAALAIATNASSTDVSRVTALQVCSLLSVREVLPAARAFARTDTNSLVRVAAIAALGRLGLEPDLKFLRDLNADGLPGVLQPAISTAAKKLANRIKG